MQLLFYGIFTRIESARVRLHSALRSICSVVPGILCAWWWCFVLTIFLFLFCNLSFHSIASRSQPASQLTITILICAVFILSFSFRFVFAFILRLIVASGLPKKKMCVFSLVNKSGCGGVPCRELWEFSIDFCPFRISAHTHTHTFIVAEFARAILFSIDLYSWFECCIHIEIL